MILVPNSNLVQLIKKIAIEAVDASKPCDYKIGTVIEKYPLKIRITQKLCLDEDFLIITQTAEERVLKVGDEVLMIRKQGGKEYVVLDKVVG